MLRIAGLAVTLTVVLPALFAYAATFSIAPIQSSEFVVPIEAVETIVDESQRPTTTEFSALAPGTEPGGTECVVEETDSGEPCEGGAEPSVKVGPEPEEEATEPVEPEIEGPDKASIPYEPEPIPLFFHFPP